MDLKNLSVMVTGGGSGMGSETAKYLAAEGAKVAVLDIQEAAAKRVASEIGGMAIACDVTQEESVRSALRVICEKQGAPRVGVQCAGVIAAARLVGKNGPMPLADYRKVIEVNLIGTFNVLRLLAEAMSTAEILNADGERGVIINTASIAAFEGQIGQVAYSASKGGVVSMTLPAARELAKFGIRVMTIAPGVIETPMINQLSAEAKQALVDACLFPKRLGTPSEYAGLVRHIIENPMLNGGVIRMDGGVRLQPK